MRQVITLWILIGVELVWSHDVFNKETQQPIVQTAQTANPTVTKRFWWHAPQPNTHEDPYKRGSRPDRFRFFHQGLGKRTVAMESANLKQYNDLIAPNRAHTLQTIKQLIKDVIADTTMQTRYFTRSQESADPFLERTPTYRTLEDLNSLYGNKRAPEVFSETLYPIQAGKQQLEVTLDRSLNDKELNTYDYDIEVNDNSNSDYDEEIQDDNDIPLKPVETRVTKTPYDLTFGSLDLDNGDLFPTYTTEEENVDNAAANLEEKDSSNSNEGRTKRWWAADKLRRFRSAKSWNQYGRRGHHIDPALYFIGLGK